MEYWKLIVAGVTALGGWFGIAKFAARRATTQRLVNVALDIADALLDEAAIETFMMKWLPRFEAALKAIGVEPTKGQWGTVIDTVREHVVAHSLARSKESIDVSVAKIEALLAHMRVEEERRRGR